MCTMEGTLHRRSFRARRSQATSSLCLAAVAATRPPCAAGPTTGEGSYAVRPANRRALLLHGGDLLVRPRARLLLRGLFWGGTSVQKVPAGRHGGGRPARQLRRISPGGGARRAGGAGRGGGQGKRRTHGVRRGCAKPRATKARGSDSAGRRRTAPSRRRFRPGSAAAATACPAALRRVPRPQSPPPPGGRQRNGCAGPHAGAAGARGGGWGRGRARPLKLRRRFRRSWQLAGGQRLGDN